MKICGEQFSVKRISTASPLPASCGNSVGTIREDVKGESTTEMIRHGNILAAPATARGIMRRAPFSFNNGSLSIVEVGESTMRIKTVNDLCHLEREGLV